MAVDFDNTTFSASQSNYGTAGLGNFVSGLENVQGYQTATVNGVVSNFLDPVSITSSAYTGTADYFGYSAGSDSHYTYFFLGRRRHLRIPW